MSSPGKQLTSLVIATGAADTTTPLTYDDLKDFDAFVLGAPATLLETVNVYISFDGTNYFKLRSGGTAIALSAGCGDVIDFAGFKKLKVTATGAVADDRTFQVHGVIKLRGR